MTLNYQESLEILAEIETNTDEVQRSEMIDLAIRYARLRVDDFQSGPIATLELGAERTRAHNALIESLNGLSRQSNKSTAANGWRERLGNDRKVIGDFACHLHTILGLRAR